MALFTAHFTQGRDVSREEVLIDIAADVGLDREAAQQTLTTAAHAPETRARQQFWIERGVSGVPAMVFEGKYLLTGAQGTSNYTQMLDKIISER